MALLETLTKDLNITLVQCQEDKLIDLCCNFPSWHIFENDTAVAAVSSSGYIPFK